MMVEDAPLGARIADFATHFLGSWKFIVFQTVVVIIWIAINVGFITGIIEFDPYPFILLNLAFSTQAAYAAPLILLAGNRSAEQDRLILEHAAKEGDVEEKQNDELLQGNTEILKKVEALEVHILNLEQTILGLLKPGSADGPSSSEVRPRSEVAATLEVAQDVGASQLIERDPVPARRPERADRPLRDLQRSAGCQPSRPSSASASPMSATR